jgi:serine/threonine-protein kinase
MHAVRPLLTSVAMVGRYEDFAASHILGGMGAGTLGEAVTRVDRGARPPPDPRATRAEGPVRTDSQSRPKSLATQTARVVMNLEDRQRARGFALVLALFGAVGALNEALVYRTGSPSLRIASIALLVGVAAGGLFLRWIGSRVSEAVRVPLSLTYVLYCAVAAVVEALHVGVLSSFQGAIVLVMFVFGLDGRKRIVLPLALLACVGNAIPTALIAAGVFADPGLFDSPFVTVGERVASTMGIFVVYATAFGVSRAIRRSMQAAVERASEAALRAQQHEALLAEANRNLDAVVSADARRGGRYTGVTVGDFRLAGIIGRGGMGEVYAAERTSDGRPAAVKLLTPQALGDSAAVARFVREVEMASKVRVPNVVEVLAAGEGPGAEPYLAMERLLGHDLSWHLRRRKSLSIEEVLLLAEHIAAGLHAAHTAGIVHRDLKPQNVFLHDPGGTETDAEDPTDAGIATTARGTWKILDFGIGKVQGTGATLTGAAVVGTPGYMAPEQVCGGRIDARTDVFALGAVVYRALTGRPPFGVAEVQAMFDVVSRQPPAPSELQRDLPKDIDRVLAIALAKEAGDRFASAPELATALIEAARQELGDDLRARAAVVLRARPWGSVVN